PVEALHGDLSQGQRDKVMKAFKAHHVKVLIATDVAARGIDVNNLSHIIHFAMPDDPAFYTHRSGRTARAGKLGLSLVLASPSEVGKLKRLEADLKIKFQLMKVPAVENILENIMKFWAERILNHK